MGMRRFRRRNGCTCEIKDHTRVLDPEQFVCCDVCQAAPTVWVAHFDCTYWSVDEHRDFVTGPCLILAKDCFLGCGYTARWKNYGAPLNGWFPILYQGSPEGRCNGAGQLGELYEGLGAGALDLGGPVYWTRDTASGSEHIQADLKFEAGNVVLLITTRHGARARYTLDPDSEIDCDGVGADRITLKLDAGFTDPPLDHLPPRICLQAQNAIEFPLRCATKEEQCACCDHGLIIVGTVDDTLIDAVMHTCRGDIGTEESPVRYQVTRIFEDDWNPAGVCGDYPGGSCGVFLITGIEGFPGVEVYVWCVDGDWFGRWCCTTNEQVANYASAAVVMIECRCEGFPLLDITLTGLPENCGCECGPIQLICDQVNCDDWIEVPRLDEEDFEVVDDVVAPCGGLIVASGTTHTWTRGQPLPCGVSPDFLAGVPTGTVPACHWLWRTFSYTPTPDCEQYPGTIGVLIVESTTGNSGCGRWRMFSAYTYCYDALADCWVLQGGPGETEQKCVNTSGSLGPADNVAEDKTVLIPNPACCCEEPECCPCADLPSGLTVSDGTNTLSATKSDCSLYPEGHYTVGGGTLCGSFYFTGTLSCSGGVWTLSLAPGSVSVTMSWDGDCDTIILTGTGPGGCSITVS